MKLNSYPRSMELLDNDWKNLPSVHACLDYDYKEELQKTWDKKAIPMFSFFAIAGGIAAFIGRMTELEPNFLLEQDIMGYVGLGVAMLVFFGSIYMTYKHARTLIRNRKILKKPVLYVYQTSILELRLIDGTYQAMITNAPPHKSDFFEQNKPIGVAKGAPAWVFYHDFEQRILKIYSSYQWQQAIQQQRIQLIA